MPTKLQKIEAEAMTLDLKSRAELVRKLELSLKTEASSKKSSEIEAERLWIQEAMKRSREIRERASGGSPEGDAVPAARAVPPKREPAKRAKAKPSRKVAAKKARARR